MFENLEIKKEDRPSDPRFGSGPSLIPTDFVAKLLETDCHLLGTSHRKPAIKNVVKGIQDGLKKYFSLPSDFEIILGNGGATFLFDAISLGMVKQNVLHYTCGEFSNKWYKSSALIPWIDAKEAAVPFGEGVAFNEDHPSYDMVCVTLNETSTGVQLKGLPDITGDTLLAVDATSGAGQISCDIKKCDVYFFSPQKVFAGEGGLWIAILSPKAIARMKEVHGDSKRYIPGIMNLETALTNGIKNQTYNTPAITTLFFLNEQIKLMNLWGEEKVVKEAKRKAEHTYSWAKEKPYLSCYIQDSGDRSTSVATIDVDDKIDVSGLLKKLHDDKIVYGIEAYRKLGRNQFRISLFHNISFDNLEKLTKLLSGAIESVL